MLSQEDFIPDLFQSHFDTSSQRPHRHRPKMVIHPVVGHAESYLGLQRPGIRQGEPTSQIYWLSQTLVPSHMGDQYKESVVSRMTTSHFHHVKIKSEIMPLITIHYTFSFCFLSKLSYCSTRWCRIHYTAQIDLKLIEIFLSQTPECRDYRHQPTPGLLSIRYE